MTIESHSDPSKRQANYLLIQSIVKNHRAVEIGLNNLSDAQVSKCRCLSVLESSAIYWNIEGPCTPLTQTFLLLGLEVFKV